MSSEHLSSVHDNPFVRQFGLLHQNRQEDEVEQRSVPSSANSEKGDDEIEQEYHVNSGFVNKLRSKFAQLENKSHKVTLSRKSASVEDLLSVGKSSSKESGVNLRTRKGSSGRYIDDTPSSGKINLRHLAPAGYKPQIRPRSNELEKSTERPPLPKRDVEKLKTNNVIRSVKPPLPKKTSFDSNPRPFRNSGSELIPKSEHHDWEVAPDLEKVGRADIVIIESKHDRDYINKNKQDSVEKKNDKSEDVFNLPNSQEGFGRVKPAVEKEKVTDENELPKPNTVSAFRTLFEKTNKNLDTLHAWRSSHSPTRKSSGSDTNSPQVLSPVSTPRSPLVRVTTDNVFERSLKSQEAEFEKPVSSKDTEDRSISPAIMSPRVTDATENVDTSSSPMRKTLEMFQQQTEDLVKSADRRESSSPERGKPAEVNSAQTISVQHTLTPVHPVSKIFDSKSVVKTDKPKRPKPTAAARKAIVPKDTIELKHEADKKRLSSSGDFEEVKNENIVDANSTTKVQDDAFDGVSFDSNVKPSKQKEKDTSPRQTKVFDSSKIVKKKREPPKVPLSPVETSQKTETPEFVPNNVNVGVTGKPANRNVSEVMEVSPVKPPRRVASDSALSSGVTEIKPNIVRNDAKTYEDRPRQSNISEQMFPKPDLDTKPEPVRMTKPADNKNAVSGMSSFLANRLKKSQPDQENQLKTSSSHLTNGSSPSPVPRKRQAPERPEVNGTIEVPEEKPQLPVTPAPALVPVRSKKIQPTATKGKMVFDSSKIASKRKEPPKRKPPRKTLEELNENITFDSAIDVPKLDLSSITNEKVETEYQEGYIPTVIKPCPFLFVGAEVKFQSSPYKKTRSSKVRHATCLLYTFANCTDYTSIFLLKSSLDHFDII